MWAQLFRQAAGFIGTTLLRPTEPGGPWLTLDHWESRTAFERFQESRGDEYRRLDLALAELTVDEQFVGAFEDPSG